MQITQFVATVDWIQAQYSDTTTDLILSNQLTDLIARQIRGRQEKSEKSDPRGTIGSVLKATTEMAIVRVKLASHPFASEVLTEFGLDPLLNEEFLLTVAETAALATSESNERAIEHYNDLLPLLEPVAMRWRLLTECVKPIRNLLIPKEIAAEKDFDEILTIELSYPHDALPQPNLLPAY